MISYECLRFQVANYKKKEEFFLNILATCQCSVLVAFCDHISGTRAALKMPARRKKKPLKKREKYLGLKRFIYSPVSYAEEPAARTAALGF